MLETIGIIGRGHIGSALQKGLERAGFVQIMTSNNATDNMNVVNNSNIVFLAVRPVIACEVLEQIESSVKDKILVSLVAGLSISIQDVSVFRLMTSLLISENMGLNVAWTAQDTDVQAKKTVGSLLSCLASTQWVDSEDEIDKATLTVGAGPGWMAEIIANLDQEMLQQTLAFMGKTGLTATQFAQMIATPGGITEAMIATQDFKSRLELSFEQGSSRMELIKQEYRKV